MADLQEQLALLRKRVARIDRKYEAPASTPPKSHDHRPARYFVEEYLSGEQITTPYGCHFETERLYESHRRHGSLDISALDELPADLLSDISGAEIENCDRRSWAFLDTETTGLAGGSGTYAFLIGVGRITREGFRLRQFFMREPGEEASLLHALAEHLAGFEALITYNGKTYDQPLLETRYRMQRTRPPFSRLAHLDLLFGARRLWRLRFESCRLMELENHILGVEREGDLPGELIPYVYFEYLRTREAFRIVPILHHNAIDILTLACLTAIVPGAFRSPSDAPLAHGAEMVGLARWFRQAGRYEEALKLFRRAVEAGLRDDLLFRSLWDIAELERKLGNQPAAIEIWADLASGRNPLRTAALEQLAKYYEHTERNYPVALELTLTALSYAKTESLERRRARLAGKVARRTASGPLL